MSDEDTYALSYRDRSGGFFYIPTCPRSARNWRGPYQTEQIIQRAAARRAGRRRHRETHNGERHRQEGSAVTVTDKNLTLADLALRETFNKKRGRVTSVSPSLRPLLAEAKRFVLDKAASEFLEDGR